MKKGGGSGKKIPAVGLGVGGSDHRSNVVRVETGREGPRFQDLGGMNMVLEDLMMEVIVTLCHPELPKRLGVRPMVGILLHGPPGCGKTKLAHAIANETGVPFYKISATEVVSGVSGASEENIRDLFNKAYQTAPSIVFIDEIDAIASKRENLQREMERRIVTQLMICMDEPHQTMRAIDSDSGQEASDKTSDKRPGYVLVIGATNRPNAVDQALRRPGRFDKEIALGVPDENARAEILSVLTRNLRIDGEFDRFLIARFSPGFVEADLAALVNKAGNLAMKRIIDKRRSQLTGGHGENFDWWRHPWSPEEIENLSITMLDFEEATKLVQPSTRREEFSFIPNIKWEDVGGLDSLRKAIDRYIVQRTKDPEDYEVDALMPKRGREGAWVVERALNQLLLELDGADQRHGVYVIGATNRFGRLFYVPLSSADERGLILKALACKKPVSPDVDYNALACREACRKFTGADLAALVNEAAMTVKEEKQMYVDQGISYDKPLVINTSHFEKALEKIFLSISEECSAFSS